MQKLNNHVFNTHIDLHSNVHYLAISIITEHYSNASYKMLVVFLHSVLRINTK